jgi:hypothetical protein
MIPIPVMRFSQIIVAYAMLSTIFVTACKKNEDNTILFPEEANKGFTELLGRPTNSSVTVSIQFDQKTEVYWEYGTTPGNYNMTTATFTAIKDIPLEVDFTNLITNTQYYYRARYRLSGTISSFLVGNEHIFHTQRAPGSTFTFTVEADEHLYDKKGVKSIYQICLNNQALDKPDFMLSLGDTFGDDHNPTTITSSDIDLLHYQYRPFLGSLCHSVPFYFCIGNHEGENDYYMAQNPPDNLAVRSTLSRKLYYPNPYPDSFYSGNTENEPYGIGNPENYFAWTWGDALFVVLDIYRYQNTANTSPKKWDWTLGFTQYTWLKNVLESSNARYKFVFAHHVSGQQRGGIEIAKLYEWGGFEKNGAGVFVYTFDSYRPGWGKPIQQLFIDNGVDILFQGHDHVFAHEVMDGITYQSLPMPADSTYQIGYLANADAYTADVLDGTGHIRVTVSPVNVKVDYVLASKPEDENVIRINRKVAFTYTIN